MTTKFNMTKDINGNNGFGLQFADDAFSATLDANTATTLTIPSNFENWIAVFSYDPGTRVWVANNADAALPAGNTFTSTSSEELPTARAMKGGDVLSFITPDTSVGVGVSLYAIS